LAANRSQLFSRCAEERSITVATVAALQGQQGQKRSSQQLF
jgi:hypothetical protein